MRLLYNKMSYVSKLNWFYKAILIGLSLCDNDLEVGGLVLTL
jgi:hypothetical protein